MFRWPVLLLALLACSAVADTTVGVDIRQCARRVAEAARKQEIPGLTATERQFLEKYLLPVAGMRAIWPMPSRQRGRLFWPQRAGETERAFSVAWEKNRKHLGVDELQDGSLVLRLPEDDPFSELTRGELLKALLGTRLHPFHTSETYIAERIALGEPEHLLRQGQAEAEIVGRHYLAKFADQTLSAAERERFRHFLSVAPPGAGKSLLYQTLLRGRLDQLRGQKGLVIVATDRSLLVRDRYDEAEDVCGTTSDAVLIEWADPGEEAPRDCGIRDVAALLKLVEESSRPVVLITTAASMRTRLGTKAVQKKLRPWMRGLFYDEAHHLGAAGTGRVARGLTEEVPECFVAGFTATPIHHDRDIVALFRNHGFWMYRDTAAGYLAMPGSMQRDVRDVALQLKEAFDEGELVGFEEVHYLALQGEGQDTARLFVPRDGKYRARRIVNPDYYGDLWDNIEEVVRNGYGIIACNDQTEAEELTAYINGKLGAPLCEEFTHKSAPARSTEERGILARYAAGKTRCLLTVTKLDEGANLHDSNYYLDLTGSPTARVFLQRVGRTTRVFGRKRKSTVLLLSPYTRSTLERKLEALATRRGAGGGGWGDGRVPAAAFLGGLAELNMDTVYFWDTDINADPLGYVPDLLLQKDRDWTRLREEVLAEAPKLFRSGSYRLDELFRAQAPRIVDRDARARYLARLDAIKLSPRDSIDARKIPDAAARLLASLAALRDALGLLDLDIESFDGVRTLIRDPATPEGRWGRLSDPDRAHELAQFRQNVLAHAGQFFVNGAHSVDTFLRQQVERIVGVRRRARYLAHLDAIELRSQDLSAAVRQEDPADRMHWAFLALAEALDLPEGDALEFTRLAELFRAPGTPEARYGRLTDPGREKMREEIERDVLGNSTALFPGFVKKWDEVVASFVPLVPAGARATFRRRIAAIGVLHSDLDKARNGGHLPKDRIYWVIEALREATGAPANTKVLQVLARIGILSKR